MQMLAQFAEDDRIEQMNAQKRRMKQLEHQRAVERMLDERRKQSAARQVCWDRFLHFTEFEWCHCDEAAVAFYTVFHKKSDLQSSKSKVNTWIYIALYKWVLISETWLIYMVLGMLLIGCFKIYYVLNIFLQVMTSIITS